MTSNLLNCPKYACKVGRSLHFSDSIDVGTGCFCLQSSLLYLLPHCSFVPLCLKARISHNCRRMCTPSRTQAHTHGHICAHTLSPAQMSANISHSPPQNVSALDKARLPSWFCPPVSLAFCLRASHLNLLSLPDISHARGSQDKLNISEVCHQRLG